MVCSKSRSSISKTSKRHRVAFPEPVYAAGRRQNDEFNTTMLRYNYQSLITPSSVFDYDMNTRRRRSRSRLRCRAASTRTTTKPSACSRLRPTARRFRFRWLYRKDMKLDGSAPLLLYGYGSYGISFRRGSPASRLPLLDRGVVFAIAHIRGGGELGEPWREAGRMMNKMNTFTDFIACAEHLVNKSTRRKIVW